MCLTRLRGMGHAVWMVALLAAAGGRWAAGEIVTSELDATSFSYYNTFESGLMPESEDLDGNSTPDWSAPIGFLWSGTSVLSYDTFIGDSAYYLSDQPNQIWPAAGITTTAGFTAEARLRVNSVATGATAGAFGLWGSDLAPSGSNAYFTVFANRVRWGSNVNLKSAAWNRDNTDEFHTFRMVQEPATETYSLYRDAVLLMEGQKSAYNRTGWNRFWFGDGGGAVGGSVDIDYVAFTSGAYAPVGFTNGILKPDVNTVPTKDSSTFTYKYEFDLDPTNPSAIDLDGNGQPDFVGATVGGGSPPALSGNGTAVFSSSGVIGDASYYESGITNTATALWSSQGFKLIDEGYTVEVRAKITSALNTTSGAIQLVTDTADASDLGVLQVGQQGVGWQTGLALDDADNSDDFHVFRLTANRLDEGGNYFIWRDGVLISPIEGVPNARDYVRNALYFGDTSGGNGGVIEMDYIRFMKGIFAPEGWTLPPKLPGDANGDDKVDELDAAILAANWQKMGGATWAQGDFNGDGNVDDLDASILAANWQSGVGGAGSVPEPGTWGLLVGLLLTALWLRRRS